MSYSTNAIMKKQRRMVLLLNTYIITKKVNLQLRVLFLSWETELIEGHVAYQYLTIIKTRIFWRMGSPRLPMFPSENPMNREHLLTMEIRGLY